MKRLLSAGVLGAAIALVTAAAPAAAQAGGLKVGFVNSQRILAETPALQQVQQQLEREMPGLRAPLDTMEQRLNTAQQQLQQQQATLTPQVREQRQNELQQQFAAYQQRAQQLQEQAQQRQQQLVAPIMQTINNTIEAVRREGGYSYVMDSSGNGILAVDPSLDLTDRVLARLRTGGTTPPAPAAGAPRP
jgi:outer membrane protein